MGNLQVLQSMKRNFCSEKKIYIIRDLTIAVGVHASFYTSYFCYNEKPDKYFKSHIQYSITNIYTWSHLYFIRDEIHSIYTYVGE